VLETAIGENRIARVEVKRVEDSVDADGLTAHVDKIVFRVGVQREFPFNEGSKAGNDGAAVRKRAVGSITSMQPVCNGVLITTDGACRRYGGIKLVCPSAGVNGAREILGH
jgi:hypothetical protein